MAMSSKNLWNDVENKWQKYWEDQEVFKSFNPGEEGAGYKKFYCLDMFPYPSGQGLHVGHPLGYVASDILCRYKRMRGYNVLHPMGWDAFGLPAEQYAIEKGVHPEITTRKNIETYKRQLNQLGLSFDWSREINTSEPSYYKWTQWIFKLMIKKGLAYQAEIPVNWCPALGTVLANDEVVDGKSERGGHPVERRPMRQWMMKITDYADRLLEDLEDLDWPESTKELQRNWIGRSEGARVVFPFEEGEVEGLEVFTTRPDTLMGVTFMVIAPEHPLLKKLTIEEKQSEVQAYLAEASHKSDLQRTDLNKDKSGVFTGGYVCHPLTGSPVPVWVADYVLMGYGTGAIMAVPAHDERDQEFALKHHIEILPVIDENGKLINSSWATVDFNGLDWQEAKGSITRELEERKLGKCEVNYRLRDWIFSRQRYWGEPIPVIHHDMGKETHGISLMSDADLPLTLPKVDSYTPTGTGESPLASVEDWVNCRDETGKTGHRETNTMPGSAGSSWYFLRFMDPKNEKEAWSKTAESYWGPVDFYMGGAEHAVGHLLYSRFWTKVLFDLGLVSHSEPFNKLFHQGMIQGEDGEKMSKSRGNVVNPDDVVAEYGADTFRLFEMFLGPVEKAKPWQTANIEGVYRFLSKYWRLCVGEDLQLNVNLVESSEENWPKSFRTLFHKTIKQVTHDIENLRHNTAISALMILLNESYTTFKDNLPKSFVSTFTLLLAPYAPYITEEVWNLLGNEKSHRYADWPSFIEKLTLSDDVQLAVQINGKVRDNVTVDRNIEENELREMVLSREKVQNWVQGKELRKFIYVKGKLVSVVV